MIAKKKERARKCNRENESIKAVKSECVSAINEARTQTSIARY